MGILAITQARIGSSRLPAKVLKKINGKTILEIHLTRLLSSKLISKVVVATTNEPESELICNIADNLGIEHFRGSLNDVLDRFYQTYLAIKENMPQITGILRATSDCTLIDPELADNVIKEFLSRNVDYASNNLEPSYPLGVDLEVFKVSAIEKAWNEASLKSEREHVTPYIWKNCMNKGGTIFSSFSVKQNINQSDIRMVVDEPCDFEVMNHLINDLGYEKSWTEYADYLLNNQHIRQLNAHITRYGSYMKSLDND